MTGLLITLVVLQSLSLLFQMGYYGAVKQVLDRQNTVRRIP